MCNSDRDNDVQEPRSQYHDFVYVRTHPTLQLSDAVTFFITASCVFVFGVSTHSNTPLTHTKYKLRNLFVSLWSELS